jgi:hypothetical protein
MRLRMPLRVRRKVSAAAVRVRVIARLHCVLQATPVNALPVQLICSAGWRLQATAAAVAAAAEKDRWKRGRRTHIYHTRPHNSAERACLSSSFVLHAERRCLQCLCLTWGVRRCWPSRHHTCVRPTPMVAGKTCCLSAEVLCSLPAASWLLWPLLLLLLLLLLQSAAASGLLAVGASRGLSGGKKTRQAHEPAKRKQRNHN